MEDFGEGVPPTGVAADGSTGTALHNRYPTDYHCAVQRILATLKPDAVRHLRSGWTGTARCAVNVWGGDPTTTWGFDGLESGVRQALGIGMSGVSRFGTDIGGYNTYGTQERLTPELLVRWIQFGAVSGVMRTKRSGLAFPSYERPQVFDAEILPHWRRYTKLHTQLYPYILAADRAYRRTGLPLMRHPGARVAPGRAARSQPKGSSCSGPTCSPPPSSSRVRRNAACTCRRGRWIDWWRSVRYRRADGSFHARAATLLRGGAERTLPAPLGELPLLARAGSVLPLLPADVDTLAPYGRGLVHLRDRRGRLNLLAFPRGRWRGRMFEARAAAICGDPPRLAATRVGRPSAPLHARGCARGAAASVRAGTSAARRPAVAAPRMGLLGPAAGSARPLPGSSGDARSHTPRACEIAVDLMGPERR